MASATSLPQRLMREFGALFRFNRSNRPWHLPVVASICVGIPLLIGAGFGRPDFGILSCVGALVILYLPQASISKRMVTLVVSSFGFSVCFAVGVSTSFHPILAAVSLGVVAMLATAICRFYFVPPPGSFFFILIASIATTIPFDLMMIPTRVGLVALGGMLSCLLAFFYSLCLVRSLSTAPSAQLIERNNYSIILQSLTIGLFVGGSYLLAEWMALDNPYWVPISCAAIMQGASFRAVWHRQVHRIAGTVVGMVLAWMLFAIQLDAWRLAVIVMGLNLIVETLVVRNYGLAVIFITPMTVLLAEPMSGALSTDLLVRARLFDIILGSVIGLVGGWVMHHPQLFQHLERQLKRMIEKSPP